MQVGWWGLGGGVWTVRTKPEDPGWGAQLVEGSGRAPWAVLIACEWLKGEVSLLVKCDIPP